MENDVTCPLCLTRVSGSSFGSPFQDRLVLEVQLELHVSRFCSRRGASESRRKEAVASGLGCSEEGQLSLHMSQLS
eukprot:6176682-Amphidinium_carterae.1